MTTCPEAADSAELSHGAPARPLWRAAAVAAALERLAHARPRHRVRALFLAGDAGGGCGRSFVEVTYPDLAEGAPILDQGGLLLEGTDTTRLLLGLAAPRQERVWLRVRDGEQRPGDRLDRALAVAERAELELTPGRAARAMLDQLAPGSASADPRDLDPRLAALLYTRCALGPRVDRQTAAIDCTLPPEAEVGDLAFELYARLGDPSVLIAWTPGAAPRVVTPPAPLRRVLRKVSAATIAPRTQVIYGIGPAPRCADPAYPSGAIGLPLMPTPGGQEDADPARFARGVRFTSALLEELAGTRFDHPGAPGYDR